MRTAVGTARLFAAGIVAAGALVSAGLMLQAGSRAPWLLIAAFVVWVLSPFVALGWGLLAARRTSARPGAWGAAGAIAYTLIAVACYARVVPMPRGTAPAFVFTALPGLSWLVLALVAGIARVRRRPPGTPPKDGPGVV